MIFGSLLGDAHLEMRKKNINAWFSFVQSERHFDYFLHVWGIITQFTPCSFKKLSNVDKGTNKLYASYVFRSRVNPIYTKFHLLFYLYGKKIVPLDLSLLRPLALAHWVAQDGTKSTSGGFYLCRDNFSHIECQRLLYYIFEKYKLNCSLYKTSKGSKRIYIKASSLLILKNLIISRLHPSMLYKITK